jgi:hypothetical protein
MAKLRTTTLFIGSESIGLYDVPDAATTSILMSLWVVYMMSICRLLYTVHLDNDEGRRMNNVISIFLFFFLGNPGTFYCRNPDAHHL